MFRLLQTLELASRFEDQALPAIGRMTASSDAPRSSRRSRRMRQMILSV